MNVHFQHTDNEFYGISEYIKPITKIAIEDNVFIEIVCEILNTFHDYSEHIVNDVKKAMEIAEYKVKIAGGDLDEYKKLEQKVEDLYWNVVSDEFAEEFKKFNQDLYNRYKFRFESNRVARYRGLLLEEIVADIVYKRFSEDAFDTGCQVYINGTKVMICYGAGNACHKETIDVAGWKKGIKYGEFYECKVNPNRFNIENLSYLAELNEQLIHKGSNKSKVGFVSADITINVKSRKDELLETCDPDCDKLGNDGILLIGRDEIYSISESVPEII